MGKTFKRNHDEDEVRYEELKTRRTKKIDTKNKEENFDKEEKDGT